MAKILAKLLPFGLYDPAQRSRAGRSHEGVPRNTGFYYRAPRGRGVMRLRGLEGESIALPLLFSVHLKRADSPIDESKPPTTKVPALNGFETAPSIMSFR